MIVEVFNEACAKISEGSISVGRACEDCNFVVYEGKHLVGSFRDAVSFHKFMRERYGDLGDEMAGLLSWFFVDYLDDDEFDYLVENSRAFKAKWEEFLRTPD